MSDAVEELVIELQDVKYKPYLAEIGFIIIKHKIDLSQFLNNLYRKEDMEQFNYIKKINPHINESAMPGDMLIIMSKPPRKLSTEEKEDLKEVQKDALEVSNIRKELPEAYEQSEVKIELAAIDTSCLNVDNHTTVCVSQKYGSFEQVKTMSQVKSPTQQDVMNFFQPILEKGCTEDPTNCVTTGIGAHLAASDRIGGNTKALDKLKSQLDTLNELMADNAKKMNASTSKAVKDIQRSEFIRKKQSILKELKSKINKNMMKAIDIPIDSKLKTNLGLSTKANIYQARGNKKVVGIKGSYASRYKYVAKLSSSLKYGGYVAAIIGTTQTMYQAYAMCSIEPSSAIAKKYNLSQKKLNDACAYETSQSIAKSTGLVAGGMGGGMMATYLVCNVAFGLETFGTSLFWCGLVAGGLGASGGAYLGAESASDFVDWAEIKLKDDVYLQGKVNASKISGEEFLYQ